MTGGPDVPDLYIPPASRREWVALMSLSPEEFAIKTGASSGFTPSHPREWARFWKNDICEQHEFQTAFPLLGLTDARKVWLSIEEHFFSRYGGMLRVWPEWGSSGIWAPPYPGARTSGGLVDYRYLPLPPDLVERFQAWQALYNDSPPGGDIELDFDQFNATGENLARDLKRCVGPRVYVEYHELVEVLTDGTTRSWRRLLGLPEPNPQS